jgi:hypothetical protein
MRFAMQDECDTLATWQKQLWKSAGDTPLSMQVRVQRVYEQSEKLVLRYGSTGYISSSCSPLALSLSSDSQRLERLRRELLRASWSLKISLSL